MRRQKHGTGGEIPEEAEAHESNGLGQALTSFVPGTDSRGEKTPEVELPQFFCCISLGAMVPFFIDRSQFVPVQTFPREGPSQPVRVSLLRVDGWVGGRFGSSRRLRVVGGAGSSIVLIDRRFPVVGYPSGRGFHDSSGLWKSKRV